jgi:hypothetical protein
LKVGDAVGLEMEPIRNPVTGDVEYDHSGQNTGYARFEYSGP